jgi:broad-specificity NMP kinase
MNEENQIDMIAESFGLHPLGWDTNSLIGGYQDWKTLTSYIEGASCQAPQMRIAMVLATARNMIQKRLDTRDKENRKIQELER